MTTKPKYETYFLSYYANKNNLKYIRDEYEEIYKVTYSQKLGHIIELSENNSFVEDTFSLNFISSSFVVEGIFDVNKRSEIKEAMIHHHQYGHLWKHLQFTLGQGKKKIRIKIDGIDHNDYVRCINGFLYTTQDILKIENKELNISDDLIDFFFNEHINELALDKLFLLQRIKYAYENNNILDDDGHHLTKQEIDIIKKKIIFYLF